MTTDTTLSDRIQALLEREPGLSRIDMFGGLAFSVQGKVCCGVIGDQLMVRLADA